MSDAWLRHFDEPDPWEPPDPRPGPIRTERTLVRPFRTGDGPALFAAIAGSRAALLPWMPWASTDHLRVDDSIFFVERVRRESERRDLRSLHFAILDADERDVLGGVGFHGVRAGWRSAEVGYWIRAELRARGLCTEATAAFTTSLLTSADQGGWGFRRLEIGCAADNHASRRVAEKLGFRLESHLRAERWYDPSIGGRGYHDTLRFGILSDEWDFEARCGRA